MVTLGALHDKTNRHQLAVPLFQEAITTYRDVYGYGHPAVADTLCLLAGALSHPNDHDGGEKYDEAVHIIKDALEIYKSIKQEDSPAAVLAWKQLAALHAQVGRFTEAKECFEIVLRIYIRIHIGACEELADTYVAFGKLMCLNKEQMEATTMYSQALTLFGQLFGDLHVKLADTLFLQGTAHMQMEMYEDAQPFFEKAMVLYSELLGPFNSKVGNVLIWCSSIEIVIGVSYRLEIVKTALASFVKNWMNTMLPKNIIALLWEST